MTGTQRTERCDLHRLVPDDWRQWRELRLRALAESPHAFGSTLAEWSGPGDTEQRWRTRLEEVPANFVASIQGSLVGQSSGTPADDPSAVELISVWVAPEARGHQISDALVSAVIEWALDRSATSIELWVRRGNGPAIALYRRLGFQQSEAPITDGEIQMVRNLRGAAR